jgi:hypothetical protein
MALSLVQGSRKCLGGLIKGDADAVLFARSPAPIRYARGEDEDVSAVTLQRTGDSKLILYYLQFI